MQEHGGFGCPIIICDSGENHGARGFHPVSQRPTRLEDIYVLPADHKWFTRLAAADIISHTLRAMRPAYPELTPEQKQQLEEARQMLESAG